MPEPLIEAAMAGRLDRYLPEVLSGDRIVLPAWQEKPYSVDVVASGTVAANGKKLFVGMAAGADVSLDTDDG